MRIIIELDEQGEVTVERQGEPAPAGSGTRVANPLGTAGAATDAGRPPAWLLRALSAPAIAPRAIMAHAEDTDGGASRA